MSNLQEEWSFYIECSSTENKLSCRQFSWISGNLKEQFFFGICFRELFDMNLYEKIFTFMSLYPISGQFPDGHFFEEQFPEDNSPTETPWRTFPDWKIPRTNIFSMGSYPNDISYFGHFPSGYFPKSHISFLG